MTPPTERGLFEQLSIHVPLPAWPEVSDICANFEQQLAEAKEREEATRKANVECVDMFNQANAERIKLQNMLRLYSQHLSNCKSLIYLPSHPPQRQACDCGLEELTGAPQQEPKL